MDYILHVSFFNMLKVLKPVVGSYFDSFKYIEYILFVHHFLMTRNISYIFFFLIFNHKLL